jgi:hypothetical protein
MANQKRYDLAYKIQAVKLARETGQTKQPVNWGFLSALCVAGVWLQMKEDLICAWGHKSLKQHLPLQRKLLSLGNRSKL